MSTISIEVFRSEVKSNMEFFMELLGGDEGLNSYLNSEIKSYDSYYRVRIRK